MFTTSTVYGGGICVQTGSNDWNVLAATARGSGDVLFCVIRPAAYHDATETVTFGELHVFVGPGFVITVRHDEASHIHAVRADLEKRPNVLRRGARAVLHALLDRVVDDYRPVSDGIQNDIDEIEDALFAGNEAGGAAASAGDGDARSFLNRSATHASDQGSPF